MKERTLTIPDIMLIAGTRIALGLVLDCCLLISSARIVEEELDGTAGGGVLTTLPLVLNVLGKSSVHVTAGVSH